MKTMGAIENAEDLRPIIMQTQQRDAALRVCFLFEDETTHEWVRESAEQIKGLVADKSIQSTWWRMNELAEPGVLAGAVSTAMRANLVVIATQATEGLPLPFYVWMNGWASNRRQISGAIVLLGAEQSRKTNRGGRVAKYLRGVAETAKLGIVFQDWPALVSNGQEQMAG